MPAQRLSAQEYIQRLRATRSQTNTAPASEPTPDPVPTPESPPVAPQPENASPQPAEATPTSTTATPSTEAAEPASETDAGLQDSFSSQPPLERVVLEWKAPNRPYKKRDRRYYMTVGTIVFLICLILFFAGQFLPIAVVISVAFLSYVLSAVPPVIVTHQLTNFGLRVDNELYYWVEMNRFWLTKKYGQPVLNLEIDRFPWRLHVMLGDMPEDKMAEMFRVVLIQEQPPLSQYEKAAAWIQKMIPLDTE